MSKLMSVIGILVAAIGAFLGVSNFTSPGQMQVVGLTYDVAAILLVGGLICLGLAGVISAISQMGITQVAPVTESHAPAVEEAVTPDLPAVPSVETTKFNGFGRKAAGMAVATTAAATATAAAAAETVAKPASDSVAETIAALEKAKSDINNALGGAQETFTAPAVVADVPEVEIAEEVEDVAEAETEVAAAEDGELFVVEEKIIRGRPARVLSDGTVEAETDEGWMRFENLDHLDEYLDATANDDA